MADRALKTWVSDQLQTLLGFSESVAVEYMVALARSATSSASLFASLQAQGVPATAQGRAFAEALYGKVPRAAAAAGRSGPDAATLERRRREQEAAALAAKNARYALLPDDDDDRPAAAPASKAKAGTSSSSRKDSASAAAADSKHKKHLRERKEGGAWEDDGTEAVLQAARSRGRERASSAPSTDDESAYAAAAAAGQGAPESGLRLARWWGRACRPCARSRGGFAGVLGGGCHVHAVESFEEYERERERDLRERDEFVDRLKARDKERTSKVRAPLTACLTWPTACG